MIVREKEKEERRGKLRKTTMLLGHREVRQKVLMRGKQERYMKAKRVDNMLKGGSIGASGML